MRKTALMVSVSAIVLVLTGCSTTAYSTKSDIVVPHTVRPPVSMCPEVQPYLAEFIDALHDEGFAVGETHDPRALQLQLGCNPSVFNLTVSASLVQGNVPILSVSATNSGWGTLLDRGGAMNGRASAALDQFQQQLHLLKSHLRIVPDQ